MDLPLGTPSTTPTLVGLGRATRRWQVTNLSHREIRLVLLADLCHHAAMFAFAGSLILVFAACAGVVVAWLLAARWSLRGKLPRATDRSAGSSVRSSRMRDSDRLAAVGGHCLAMAMVLLFVWVAVASGTFGELLPGERAVVFATGCGFAAPVVIGLFYLRRNMVG